MEKILNNLEVIVVATVAALRAIIALPLAFAAVRHFNFLNVEAEWLVYLVAYISIFAVEIIMTLFSFLTANFRKAKLQVAYYTALVFVFLFFLLNAFLLWEMTHLYTNASMSAIMVLQALNIASVALAESLGFITNEKVKNNVVIKEATGNIDPRAVDIKNNSNIGTKDKVLKLAALNVFSKQDEYATFLGVSQGTISTHMRNIR